jgi:hypothetical protein
MHASVICQHRKDIQNGLTYLVAQGDLLRFMGLLLLEVVLTAHSNWLLARRATITAEAAILFPDADICTCFERS